MSCPEIRKKNSTGLKKKYDSGERLSGAEQYKTFSDDSKNKMLWSKGKTLLNCDQEVFVEKSIRTREWTRTIILRDKLIEYKCKECGIDEWRGKPLNLELDHINGINNDNRLENLRFLCLNCHSQTETYRGRNRNTGRIKVQDNELIEALKTSKTVEIALRSVGLSTGTRNYKRIMKLITKHQIDIKGWEI
jgi:Zn finger protein HypA/HybF involved in hydrogenase expression